jgi:hypothetical protein
MKTLAIVIGNNNYYGNAKLENAVNDANSIAEVFKRLGYDVIYKHDCTTNNYIDLLDEFDKRIKNYDASIFYFAGHGFQLDGENYLTSIDCQVANPSKYHCSKTCITLTEILDILKKNSDKVNIIIIDACRRSFDRGTDSAFTPIQAPKGTLIAFSTSPNEGAKDGGLDGHSIYTGALLKYIGREWISVEELFKKVRKTVYHLTDGKQTTWEHTSLIGDFFFNSGQLVHSLEIPYDDSVVKDNNYKINGTEFSSLIIELKSNNWDRQNPAIDRLLRYKAKDLDKNQLFILGRNLLQATGYAFKASDFFRDLASNLKEYSTAGENHLLNGILFEIYFDSYGEFRKGNFKMQDFDKVMALRGNPAFSSSFDFIRNIIAQYRDFTFWIPEKVDSIIDVDVLATPETMKGDWEEEQTYEVINKINVFSKDITKDISRYGIIGNNEEALKNTIAKFLAAPTQLIQINSNIKINSLIFQKFADSAELDY